MVEIHPTAIVDKGATLGEGVKIGPYSIVGGDVTIGDGGELQSHVIVQGRTTIGVNVRIFPFAAVGLPPQDLKFSGEDVQLIVGDNVIIREHATLHPGTATGGMVTRVGDNCLLMVGCHIAHDCTIGNHVILANNAAMGGHVEIQDHAILGGMVAMQQFVRIGRHAMIGGAAAVENDVIPYGSVKGNRAYLNGLNIVGLKRRGFSRDDINTLRAAYRMLFATEGTLQQRLQDVDATYSGNEQVKEIVEFIRADSSRALCQPNTTHGN